jgi:hypothetical protein
MAILLEGNPVALQLVALGLAEMNGNANALLEDLLYGCFDFENDAHRRFRIVRTFYGVQLTLGSIFDYDNSLIHPNQFAPLWTLVPSDLNYYFWFLFYPFRNTLWKARLVLGWPVNSKSSAGCPNGRRTEKVLAIYL